MALVSHVGLLTASDNAEYEDYGLKPGFILGARSGPRPLVGKCNGAGMSKIDWGCPAVSSLDDSLKRANTLVTCAS